MDIFKKVTLCLLCLVFFMPGYIAAQEQDIDGSEDHPLISRYPGSYIYRYATAEFDEYILPVGPLDGNQLTETMLLEGKVTKIQYRVGGRSTLEVYRNYESALAGAGFEMLFEKQGRSFMEVFNWVKAFYDRYSGQRWASQSNPSFAGEDFRYAAAKLPHPDGDIYVSLYVTTRRESTIQLDIIEAAPMEVDLVTVDAAYLRDELRRTGFVAIYGIHFETDAAEMTAESRPALDEIAALLRDNPEFDLYVVGHTDNVGRYEYNLTLSQQRAGSVTAELVDNYGIAPGRLHPVGVGPVAPVAVNTTPEGRAENRRVVLVAR
jgi:OmpA-OmpF porin, OOP family